MYTYLHAHIGVQYSFSCHNINKKFVSYRYYEFVWNVLFKILYNSSLDVALVSCEPGLKQRLELSTNMSQVNPGWFLVLIATGPVQIIMELAFKHAYSTSGIK